MTRNFLLFACALALTTALGCGDDDGGGGTDSGMPPGTDGGPPTGMCSLDSPMPEQQQLPCCYRASNADRLDMPELRVASTDIETPSSLASAVVDGLLDLGFERETFNWLIRLGISGSDVTIETGYGERSADGTFAFTMGTAPGPGSPDRWDPVTVMATIDGETVSAPTLDGTFTVPVFDAEMPDVLILELPIRGLSLEQLTLSNDRTCVGTYNTVRSRFETGDGRLTGFITVAEAQEAMLVLDELDFSASLCTFIAQPKDDAGGNSTCDAEPQTNWDVPPDSLCPAMGACETDPGDGSVCDASTCNAWLVGGGFAAHGVEIAD